MRREHVQSQRNNHSCQKTYRNYGTENTNDFVSIEVSERQPRRRERLRVGELARESQQIDDRFAAFETDNTMFLNAATAVHAARQAEDIAFKRFSGKDFASDDPKPEPEPEPKPDEGGDDDGGGEVTPVTPE